MIFIYLLSLLSLIILQSLKKILKGETGKFYKVKEFTDPHTHTHTQTHTHTHKHTQTHTHTQKHTHRDKPMTASLST